MEIKKSPQVDLQTKKGLFLQIGLVVSLILTIVVFGWSQKEKVVDMFDMGNVAVEEEIIEITRQDQKPPEPIKQTIAVVSDIINVVKNEAKITTAIDFNEYADDKIFIPQARQIEKEADDNVPFIIVEDMPKFQNGDLNTFRTWVMTRLKYPTIAAENGIQGKVTLVFVIEQNGSLTNIQALQSPDRSLTDEAVRVLQTSPKWTPGKQRGVPVRVKYTLPVDFKIQQ